MILRSYQHEPAVAVVAVVAWLVVVGRRAAFAAVIVDFERSDAIVESQRMSDCLRYTNGLAVSGIALYAVVQC